MIKKFVLYILFSFILIMPTALFSQEEEEENKGSDTTKFVTEEMVITGSRYLKKIIDVPYSIYRVERKELDYGRKISARDVLADVPGLFLQSRFGNNDIRISIRGFGTRSNSGIRGVRILQDGIPETETDGESVIDAVDFSSLGGVEVVKGNQSVLYSNATGGVINFLSDFSFQKTYFASYNQFGRFGNRQNGLKVGVKEDNYRFFMSYNYTNIDGFRDHSSQYTNLVNGIFSGLLGAKSTIDVLFNYVNGLNRLPGSLTEAQYNENGNQARDIAISQDFRRDTKKGRLGLRYRTYFGKGDNNELEITGFSGLKDLIKTDDITYQMSTRYTVGSYARWTNKSQYKNHNNDFTLGVDYQHQSGPVTEFNNIGGNRDLTISGQFEDISDNIGAYFQDQVNLLPEKMDLYFAGRYDRIEYSKSNLQFSGMRDTIRVFEHFTPKVALNYKLTPTIALYTTYGLGFDTPILTELENITHVGSLLNPILEPSKTYNFEFGIKGNLRNTKGEFMKKMYFEATVFNYEIHDDIVPYTIDNLTYYRTATHTNRKGLELGIMTEPVDRVELSVNYVFTHFKYKDYKTLTNTPEGTTLVDYTDHFVPSYPQHIVNFVLNYEWYISKNLNGLLQFDCDYVAKMYVDDDNIKSTGAYFYSNPLAGLSFTYENLNILAFAGAYNLFNKKYVGYVNINDYYGRYYNTGEPRNIYGGVHIKFNI